MYLNTKRDAIFTQLSNYADSLKTINESTIYSELEKQNQISGKREQHQKDVNAAGERFLTAYLEAKIDAGKKSLADANLNYKPDSMDLQRYALYMIVWRNKATKEIEEYYTDVLELSDPADVYFLENYLIPSLRSNQENTAIKSKRDREREARITEATQTAIKEVYDLKRFYMNLKPYMRQPTESGLRSLYFSSGKEYDPSMKVIV